MSNGIVAWQIKLDHGMETAIQFMQKNIELVGNPNTLIISLA
jgi:hypothetical protein